MSESRRKTFLQYQRVFELQFAAIDERILFLMFISKEKATLVSLLQLE